MKLVGAKRRWSSKPSNLHGEGIGSREWPNKPEQRDLGQHQEPKENDKEALLFVGREIDQQGGKQQ